MSQSTGSVSTLRLTPIFIGMCVLVGLIIGVLTIVLQKLLPDSVIQLANSGAVWSIVAFVIGRKVGSWRIAAIGGFVALVGEVAGYYLVAYFADLMDISTGTLAVIGLWLVIALVAGPLFGWAGYVSVHGQGLRQKIGIASLGGVFIGEGLYLMSIQPKPNTGLLWLVIAIVVTLLLTWKSSERMRIWLITIALGLLFFGGEQLLVLLDQLRAQSF
ncbi:MAG: hypothetical protein H7175_10970 [Burkholderiales bacterium]|nr:hypothetical protein [Anaerolineae bacterium]